MTMTVKRRTSDLVERVFGPVPPGSQDHPRQYRVWQAFVVLLCPALVVTLVNDWIGLAVAVAVVAVLGVVVLAVCRRRR